LLKKLGMSFKMGTLKHEDVNVPVSCGGNTITAVVDLEAQILSLLLDTFIMQQDSFANGYNIFTGKATCLNLHYGKMHTGDAWEHAHKHFCGDDYPKNMPISLVVFGDVLHFDSKGTLKVMPLMFTLSLFNQKARNEFISGGP
jgi:hypothetical protein